MKQAKRTTNSKLSLRYKLVGALLLTAGFTNVGASFATEQATFAVSAIFFFLAAIFYFVRARQVKNETR